MQKDNICKWYQQKDTTYWHGDVFEHPSYQSFCTWNGEKRELLLPDIQCARCKIKMGNSEGGKL